MLACLPLYPLYCCRPLWIVSTSLSRRSVTAGQWHRLSTILFVLASLKIQKHTCWFEKKVFCQDFWQSIVWRMGGLAEVIISQQFTFWACFGLWQFCLFWLLKYSQQFFWISGSRADASISCRTELFSAGFEMIIVAAMATMTMMATIKGGP